MVELINVIAILVYAVFAQLIALVLAVYIGSPLAISAVFVSAGSAYLFQALESQRLEGEPLSWAQIVLWAISVGLLILSVIYALFVTYGG